MGLSPGAGATWLPITMLSFRISFYLILTVESNFQRQSSRGRDRVGVRKVSHIGWEAKSKSAGSQEMIAGLSWESCFRNQEADVGVILK